MAEYIHITLAFIAISGFSALGYEIQFGGEAGTVESELHLLPNGYRSLGLKLGRRQLAELTMSAENETHYKSESKRFSAVCVGDRVTVTCSNIFKAGPAELTFEKGYLRRFKRDGNETLRDHDFAILTAKPNRQVRLKDLWRLRRSDELKEKAKVKWWQDGRLRLGYFNPNAAGTLFAELSALFTMLVFVFRRRCIRLVCAAGAAIALVALFMTGSRGSFIAFSVGIAVAVLLNLGRRFFRKNVLVRVLLVVVFGVIVVFAIGQVMNDRFGAQLLSLDAGNVQRLRCWLSAPDMMAAAPGGWGEEPGRAYCDWFQHTKDNHRLYYLVNSHLTWMVQHGWLFRSIYVSAWLALLALLFSFIREKSVSVAVAVWSTFAVALWFSTVGIFPTLWFIPVLVLVIAMFSMRHITARKLLAVVFTGLIGALLPFGSLLYQTRNNGKASLPIHRVTDMTILGQGVPEIFVVRDNFALSDERIGRVGHEIREFLADKPNAAPLAVADGVSNLPERVATLVLVGRGGASYLKYRAEHLADGKYCHAQKTIFVSPPFSPSAIPLTLSTESDVSIMIGAFAAAHEQAYHSPPPWVRIIPDCELYIPGWLDLVLEEHEKGRRS